MSSGDTQSLQNYVSRAVHAAWKDHDSLGDKGKELVDMCDEFGRRNTRLDMEIMRYMREAVAFWCKLPHLGVRVYTPCGSEVHGNPSITHNLWFSGLWSPHVYRAFDADHIAKGRTPGYGVAFAVAEKETTFHRIRGAAIIRFDTGEKLSRGDCGETWLSNKRAAESGMTPVPYGAMRWDPLKHTILADAHLLEALTFRTVDTNSTFGNAFIVLACQQLKINGVMTLPVAAVASFGTALPAVYHLARGTRGDVFLSGFRRLGDQQIDAMVAEAMCGPAILGSGTGVALSIVGDMARAEEQRAAQAAEAM